MAQAEYPLIEFQQSLQGKIGPNSIQQTTTAIRRALKHIGPEHIEDPQMLAYYRASLPEKTRNVFGCAWNKFVAWSAGNGVTLPQTLNMPKTRFIHPLWADITDMTTYWTPEAIERMTWSDERLLVVPEETIAAAKRTFSFFAGRSPSHADWLIPARIDSTDPLPAWVLTGILRSDERATAGIVERLWRFVVENATRRGVTAFELQQLYGALWDNRVKLSRDPDAVKVVMREIAEDVGLPWTVSHRRIADLIGSQSPAVGDLIYW